MKAKWLLEKDCFEENIESFIKALKDLNFEHKITEYVPFMDGGTYYKTGSSKPVGIQDLFDKQDCIVMYGSIQLAREVMKYAPWVPGVYADFPKYECTYYYPKLYNFILNKPYIMLPFGDLLNQRYFLYETLGNNDCVFIRPSSGSKLFTGQVVKKEEYEKDIEFFNFYNVDHDKIVIVAEAKNIQAEWRTVAVNKQIIGASQYKLDGKSNVEKGCPQEVLDLAKKIVETWEPEAAWTVDICRLEDGSFHLLEIGSFSCASIYACNPYDIIEAVSEQATKDWHEINDV